MCVRLFLTDAPALLITFPLFQRRFDETELERRSNLLRKAGLAA